MIETKKKPFLNFMMVDTKKDVEKDQPRVLSGFFCTLIFILLIMDVVGVLFYLKTSKRIEVMNIHPFTKVIESSIKKSKEDHDRFTTETHSIIKE